MEGVFIVVILLNATFWLGYSIKPDQEIVVDYVELQQYMGECGSADNLESMFLTTDTVEITCKQVISKHVIKREPLR